MSNMERNPLILSAVISLPDAGGITEEDLELAASLFGVSPAEV